MMPPPKYVAWRNALGFDGISFGAGGIRIFPLAGIDEAQVGYSRSESGESLSDGAEGSWKTEWVVIGYETALGGPIILDTSHPDFQVMTATHGEGSWETLLIAKPLEGFGAALRAIRGISAGRENPAELEKNPLSDDERERTLQAIKKANGDEIEMDFWDAMLQE